MDEKTRKPDTGKLEGDLKLEAECERLGLEFEITFFLQALKLSPDNPQIMEALALAYTEAGRYEQGLELDKKLVELAPGSAIAHYNLACSLSLMQKLEESSQAILKAFQLGYKDFDYLLKDSDLQALRASPYFQQIRETFRCLS